MTTAFSHSSFVGLAVMIILFPVPAWVAKTLSGVQKAKMKAVRTFYLERRVSRT